MKIECADIKLGDIIEVPIYGNGGLKDTRCYVLSIEPQISGLLRLLLLTMSDNKVYGRLGHATTPITLICRL
jgi:hypothetical protein